LCFKYPVKAFFYFFAMNLFLLTLNKSRPRAHERVYVDANALGYEKAQELEERTHAEKRTVREIVITDGILTADQFDPFITPENVIRLGSPARENEK
jgi:hypothetical protein